MERKRKISEDPRPVEAEGLWDKVTFWSSVWASVSTDFRGVSLSNILLDRIIGGC